MRTRRVLTLFCALSVPVFSVAGEIDVTFHNNSENLVRCDVYRNGQYTAFLRLQAEKSKSITSFQAGSGIRCWHSISADSTTPLTYFKANLPGTYELLMERVKCGRECKGAAFRWATIVSMPNGETTYNKMERYNN